MLVFLITDQNFNQVKSQSENTIAGITTKLHKTQNKIKISINSLAPFAIYKWEQDGHFAISNRLENISKYIAQFGCELTYISTNSKYLYMTDVNHTRDCSNVIKITQWAKVIINRLGEIQVVDPKKQLFSIELTSKRGVKYLLKWLKKYLIIAKQEIEKNNFIPTLTGGLDTRTLTWFWRDIYKGNYYYLRAVKPDGKNCVEKGNEEILISNQVLNHLNMQLIRTEKIKGITFAGTFTETGYKDEAFNNPEFFYDYVAYHFNKNGRDIFYCNKQIAPFGDNLYLQLKHPESHFARVLLALLLSPDLLNVPLHQFVIYEFNKNFSNLFPRVEQFIAKYNLNNRVAKIKNKILKY